MSVAEREQLVKKALNIFLLLFLSLGALLGGMFLVFYQLQIKNYDERLRSEEIHSVDLLKMVAQNHFASILGDLIFLSGQEDLKTYLADSSARSAAFINNEYLTFSASKKIYDQIRYLDASGQEVARVNYNSGAPAVVARDKLQNKHQRYYFSDTFKKERGEVFVSPLDLNVEHGTVETPFKPMIRFGTPVFDQSGEKRGIVLLNYLGQNLLNLIKDVASVASGQTMLLNSAGFWLMHPEADKEWGFMFDDQAQLNFARQFPEVWAQILTAPAGQISTAQGIYTFTTLSPLGGEIISGRVGDAKLVNSDGYFWKMVSFISAAELTSYSRGLIVNLFALGAGLFLLTAVGAWYLAMAITKRKLYQAQLFSMAHFDNLTGLPNRTLFFDRLSQGIKVATRQNRQCALLYIDLDGFKAVNDGLGHDAGDELLAAVAERLDCCCRDSDTVARLGGDEFAVLLSEVSNAAGAQVCTEKILAILERPFSLTQGDAQIGASIGIGLFPNHGATLDELLKSSDRAMYLSKSRGKNTFTFADEVDSPVNQVDHKS